MAVLEQLEDTIRSAAERAGAATVGIGSRWSRGSGVVVARNQVATNAHNAPGGEVRIVFPDGREETGTVAGADADAELAVITVDTGDIDPVELGESATSIGDAVVALANPGGRGLHATLGFVSSVERVFRGPRGTRIEGAIEHTAPMVRGSSGGPLLDRQGRLVGINTHRLDGGLYLALPADDDLGQRIGALGRGEVPQRLRLGVAVAPAEAGRRLRAAVGLDEREGLLVREVDPDGPAGRAGVRRGDLITSVAGKDATSPDVLHGILRGHDVTQSLLLGVVRGSEELEVAVTFGDTREEGAA